MWSKAIERYQQKLKDLGFNPGKIDGYWGSDTENAMKAAQRAGVVDQNGHFIKKGNKATQQKSSYREGQVWRPIKNSKGQIIATPELAKECALWANRVLQQYNNGRDYTSSTVGGNAWTRNSRGNAQTVYSGYSGLVDKTRGQSIYQNYLRLNSKKNRTQAENKKLEHYVRQLQQMYQKESIARNKAAADKLYKDFDSNTLDKNKTYIVNMGYSRSPNAGIAWMGSEKGTTGTHTGNLYWDPSTNSWRVAHNLNHNGIITDDDFISIQGGNNSHGYYVTDISYIPTRAAIKAAKIKGGKKAEAAYRDEHYIKSALNDAFGFFEDDIKDAYKKGTKRPIYNKQGGMLQYFF